MPDECDRCTERVPIRRSNVRGVQGRRWAAQALPDDHDEYSHLESLTSEATRRSTDA